MLFDHFLFVSTGKLIDHLSFNIDTLMLEYGVRFELLWPVDQRPIIEKEKTIVLADKLLLHVPQNSNWLLIRKKRLMQNFDSQVIFICYIRF